jgi:ketosteroid isomerase-like protein
MESSMWFAQQLIAAGVICVVMFGPTATSVAAASEAALVFSADPAISAAQHAAYDVVHQYEQYLNAGDTRGILDLFAPQSVAEWNDKPTYATRQQKATGYEALFKIAKFSTIFGYASIDVDGDMAIVRTFHHKGAAVLENGKEVTDFNREVFILRKINGVYKIVFYMFNTDPVQGEG